MNVIRPLLFVVCIGLCASVDAGDYAWWPLNDGQGDVAQNLVPGGTPGDIIDADTAGLGPNGSVWVNDPDRGTVLGLNGSSGWVDAGELPIMTFENQFSWSFWAKQSSTQAVDNDIIVGNRVARGGGDTSPREFIKFTPTQFEFHTNGTATGNIPYDSFEGPPDEGADIPSDDQWYHHAVVKQGDTLTYYRNGMAKTSTTFTVGMGSPDPLPFGLGGQGDAENWRGYLSDVQLYQSALDVDGIAATMNGEQAAGDLYARWKLDDGDSGTAVDIGPNNFDGEIIDWDFDGLAADGKVWVDDPDRGTVLGLGGGTAWVDAGELPLMDLDNDFTWTFWARQDPDQVSPANDIVIGNRYDVDGVDTVPREFIKFTPDRFEFHLEGTGVGDLQYSEAQDGPWVSHIVVKDGDTLEYFRDGELAGEAVMGEEQLSPDPFPFALGGQDGTEHWAGFLSEVRLFDHALDDAEIAELSSGGAQVDGDYNNDGLLDAVDLDLQAAEMMKDPAAQNLAKFDHNKDGVINVGAAGTDMSKWGDRLIWIRDLRETFVGDSNLDGVFNSGDLVQVFGAGLYETGDEAGWAAGDWSGDKLFNSSDLVFAFSDGGYVAGAQPVAVPEPASLALVLIGGLLTWVRWRSRR